MEGREGEYEREMHGLIVVPNHSLCEESYQGVGTYLRAVAGLC